MCEWETNTRPDPGMIYSLRFFKEGTREIALGTLISFLVMIVVGVIVYKILKGLFGR